VSWEALAALLVLAVYGVVDALQRARVREARGDDGDGRSAPLGAPQLVALAAYPAALLVLHGHVAVWAPIACAGVHFVDLGVARTDGRPGRAVLRIGAVVGVLLVLAAAGVDGPGRFGVSSAHRGTVATLAGYVAAYALVIGAGQDLVRAVLEATRALPTAPAERETLLGGDPPMGRAIGVLERLILVTFVLVGAWAGIGMIVAAKSIARFRELEQRAFAEYYLVGTLASVLVALAVGGVVRGLLGGGLP